MAIAVIQGWNLIAAIAVVSKENGVDHCGQRLQFLQRTFLGSWYFQQFVKFREIVSVDLVAYFFSKM